MANERKEWDQLTEEQRTEAEQIASAFGIDPKERLWRVNEGNVVISLLTGRVEEK